MKALWEKIKMLAAGKRNRRHQSFLSTKMISVYSLIGVIPVIALGLFQIIKNRNDMIRFMNVESESAVSQYQEMVQKNVDIVHNVETSVKTNSDLIFFLLHPDDYSIDERIRIIRDEVSDMEHMLSVSPIHSVHLFLDESIEERFPVFLHQSRLTEIPSSYWEFNKSYSYMEILGESQIQNVCATSQISKYMRNLGYLQVVFESRFFFPFLFSESSSADSHFLSDSQSYRTNYAFIIRHEKNGDRLEMIGKSGEREDSLRDSELLELTSLVLSSSSSEGIPHYVGKKKMLAVWRTLPQEGIAIVQVNFLSGLHSSLLSQVMTILLLMVVMIVIIVNTIFYATHKMLEGIYSLIGGINQVRDGNLDVSLKENGSREVKLAQRNFNAMTKQLKQQAEQIEFKQQIIIDTERKALQNQINAHFIFNVLETIRMQAELSNEESVAESIATLGTMMHYCLRWRVHTVSLSKEIEYIRSYIYILNIRNEYQITLEMEIGREYREVPILKMILQPLVENSFYHAIEPLEKDAVIKIFAVPETEKGKLWLCVQDFGPGMSEEKRSELLSRISQGDYEEKDRDHIGIKNIQQRLLSFYGSDFLIQIDSEPEKGCTVKIPIPFLRKKL